LGLSAVFAVPEVSFDPEELDSAMAARGWDCDSQCDHMSFARLTFAHSDFALAAIESRTFARDLARYFAPSN
jgi:hypothetical protein